MTGLKSLYYGPSNTSWSPAHYFDGGWGRHINPERVGIVMVVLTAMLVAGLLIILTPENIYIDANTLDPAGVWPSP
jgi:hypothetical protein